MKIILKTLLLIALTGLLSYLTACAPKSQQDCGFVQNVYGERISWKGKVPVVMKLHESVPKEYYSSIAEAAEKWNQALGKTVILVDTEDIQKGPTQSFKD
ncbi:MAG: peptidase, partial [Bdellovibrionaceae bacterium]|nr:peptidase [Pseudobdellovibrionaceae bacterium]